MEDETEERSTTFCREEATDKRDTERDIWDERD
jgi:hypothetical protein